MFNKKFLYFLDNKRKKQSNITIENLLLFSYFDIMKHLLSGRKFNRDKSARNALLRALATSLITNGKITTTLEKAKDIRPVVEKLITKAKQGKSNIAIIRYLSAFLYTKESVDKAFIFAEQYNQRNGGYLRILKNGTRKGDNAAIAIIEFVK